MLRKAGKKSYHAPKSWRPIALLPVVGKVLEKIVTKIRPIISYACPAWFMHIDGVDLKYGITEGLIEKLESLQYQCLVQISGAMKYTSRQVLEKELNVESVRVFLCRLGASQRARALSDPDHGMILQITTPPRWEPLSDAVHPYRILENISQLLKAETLRKLHELNEPSEVSKIWSDPTRQKKAINSHVAHKGQEWSAKLWTSYRRQRAQERKHRTEATDDDWGPMAWSYYKPLTRAQSTMLLHCRTGVIGLNYYLFSIGSRPDREASRCPCGTGEHTAEHLFLHCPDLRKPRSKLRFKLSYIDMHSLLTRNAAVAADWALTYFGIQQFQSAKADSQFQDPNKLEWFMREHQFEHPKKQPHSLDEGT